MCLNPTIIVKAKDGYIKGGGFVGRVEGRWSSTREGKGGADLLSHVSFLMRIT